MNEIPANFINEWFDSHPGDVFRCCQHMLYRDDIKSETRNTFPHVFIARIDNTLYVANERDVYNNSLGQFYSHIGLTDEKPLVTENYIRAYPATLVHKFTKFASFFSTYEEWNNQQEMPWFSEDKFNKMKFLADIYKTINKE